MARWFDIIIVFSSYLIDAFRISQSWSPAECHMAGLGTCRRLADPELFADCIA
jgi:hypothetical protein